MSIDIKKITGLKFLMIFFAVAACTPDYSDDPIPVVPFDDIYIELVLPAYTALKTDGGYMYMKGGVRGILLYRASESSYIAYERNCSYHPNDACATVNMDQNTRAIMVDPCCQSTFALGDGSPRGGPARVSLNRYRTILSGTTLTLTSEVLN